MKYKSRGKTFDDLDIGDKVTTIGRTITETDVIHFAGISDDFHPKHMNKEYAKKAATVRGLPTAFSQQRCRPAWSTKQALP
jgi:acyl dehydratase